MPLAGDYIILGFVKEMTMADKVGGTEARKDWTPLRRELTLAAIAPVEVMVREFANANEMHRASEVL